MSFAKQAASAVVNHTERRHLCKVAQAVAADYAAQDEEEEDSNWKRNLLWTLAGLGVLGGGAWAAHKSGVLDAAGSKVRDFLGGDEGAKKGLVQRGLDAASEIPNWALGATGAANAMRGTGAGQRLSPFGSARGATGLARQLRDYNPELKSEGAKPTRRFLSMFGDPTSVEQTYADRVRANLRQLPEGTDLKQLERVLDKLPRGRSLFGFMRGATDEKRLADLSDRLRASEAFQMPGALTPDAQGKLTEGLRQTARTYGLPTRTEHKGRLRDLTYDEMRANLGKLRGVLERHQDYSLPHSTPGRMAARAVTPFVLSRLAAPAGSALFSLTGADRPEPKETD